MKRPLRSFGSNHVDFGGMRSPASATPINSVIEVGYIANADPACLICGVFQRVKSPDSADKTVRESGFWDR